MMFTFLKFILIHFINPPYNTCFYVQNDFLFKAYLREIKLSLVVILKMFFPISLKNFLLLSNAKIFIEQVIDH